MLHKYQQKVKQKKLATKKMEEKVFFEGKFGKICGVLHSANNKDEIVIIIHGFHATKETSAKINADILEKLGINSLRIDLDNIGESDLDFCKMVSIPNYVSQVESTTNFVKEKGYKQISLLGTSFGGLVALAIALKHPEIKRIFLRAPLLDLQKKWQEQIGEKKLAEFERKGSIPYISSAGDLLYYSFNCYASAKNYSMFKLAKDIKQPIMIIHGDADVEVDYSDSKSITKKFPNATLKIIEGADHTLGVNGDFSEGTKLLKEFFSKK
jgi:pimeloyl-ACP methyl ester carboxylesterase